MGEKSKFPKSQTLEILNLKPDVWPQNNDNFKLKWSIALAHTENKSEKLFSSTEFSILRLTFYRKAASKSWIQD